MTKHLLFAALLCAPAGLAAQQPTPAGTAHVHAGQASAPGETLICRTDDELGSRIAKHKTCMTAAQWREYSSEVGRSVDQRTATLSKPGGN